MEPTAAASSERKQASLATIVFPIVVVAFAALGAFVPQVALPIGPYVPWLLGFISSRWA